MNRFAGFMGLFGRACAASTSGAQDCNQETVRTTVLYMNNSTYVCSIRRADSALEAGRGPLPSPTYANCERSFGAPVEGLERLERVPRQAAGMRNVPGKAAVLLMADRTAAVSQDLDLRKGVLLACLLGPVSHEHELDGNQREKCITDQDQRELNHGGNSFVMWSIQCNLDTVLCSGPNTLIPIALRSAFLIG